MKRLLKDCPRNKYTGKYRGIAIKSSELKDEQGREIVVCNCCAFGTSKGGCRFGVNENTGYIEKRRGC